MTITWGNNTVHTLPGTPAAAPAAPAFGAPAAPAFGAPAAPAFGAPAAPSAFGAPAPAPGGVFGTPSPAPPGGSLFGSTSTTSAFGQTPASTSSIFGTPAAPSQGGLFGTPAPAPGGSLFGAPSLFGSPAPAPFGQQQQPQQPQIPAHAALHAHTEALNRHETEKIKGKLAKLYTAYSGQVTPTTDANNKNFVTILYNDLTPEQRQLQWLHGMGASAGEIVPVPPPHKPPQVSESDWYAAAAANPDPMMYMPAALVGADSLNARVSWQQQRANDLAKSAESIKVSHGTVKDLFAQGQKRLEEVKRAHSNHRKRLLDVMRKVEVVRCMNQQLQPDEVKVMARLRDVDHQVRHAQQLLAELDVRARSERPRQHAATTVLGAQDCDQISKVLAEHREELKKVSNTVAKDGRDVELMKERVIPQLGGPPPSR